jgi:hypothetical protein
MFMKRLIASLFIGLFATVQPTLDATAQGFYNSEAPQDTQMKVLVSGVNALGSSEHNSSAVQVKQTGIELVILAKGDRVETGSNGKIQLGEKISQLNFVLPGKASDRTALQDICIRRFESMQLSNRQMLELTFSGKKAGTGNFIVTKILGCSDVPRAAVKIPRAPTTSTKQPKPARTPAPKK